MELPLKMSMRHFENEGNGGVSFALQTHSLVDPVATCKSLIREIPISNLDSEDVISCVLSSLAKSKTPIEKTVEMAKAAAEKSELQMERMIQEATESRLEMAKAEMIGG